MFKFTILTLMAFSFFSCNQSKPISFKPTLSAAKKAPPVSNYFLRTIKGEVTKGQGFYHALKSISIDNDQALVLINELRDEVEFSKLKVGDKLVATFDGKQKLVKFSLSQNLVETHIVNLNAATGNWDYSLKVLDTFWQPRMLEGNLRAGSTLESDLLAEGLSKSVANEVVNVLLCKVNFRMSARAGDQYKVLLSERKYRDQVVGTKVLFTSYNGKRAGHHKAYYYEDEQKGSTYTSHYTEKGQALVSSGLRYPLSRLHVRSGFGWRRHPVTGKRAMHRGVDLRGRHGAKVHAVAAGKVVMSNFGKYAGNKVGIRHKDKSTSYYYHLSKRGVKVGQWVKSHQVIGRVGSTGRVTGAHLHFGFKRPNGKWMNPLNKKMIATPKLKGERFAKLTTQIDLIKGTLADLRIGKETKYLVARFQNIKGHRGSLEDFIYSLRL